MKNTYRISVHETEDPIRLEHGTMIGWILIEQNIPLFGLREIISQLFSEGYTKEGTLIEKE